jgi:hypothetical protein
LILDSIRRFAARSAAVSCLAALAITGCGGGSDDSASSTASSDAADKKSSTTSSTPSAAERAQAKRALDSYQAAIAAFNPASDSFSTSETRDATAGDTLALRHDVYGFRNAVFKFDHAVRRIDFPASVVPTVNALLDADGRMISQLDDISQAHSANRINVIIGAGVGSIAEPSNAVTSALDEILGSHATPPPSSPELSPRVRALARALKPFLKDKNSVCTANEVLKARGAGGQNNITAGNLETLLNTPQSKWGLELQTTVASLDVAYC